VGPKVVVYAGPTIPAQAVHTELPGATARPPVARGDLLAERWRPGDTAVIIDGYFRERRSVGHKEILLLLDEGVHVVGAASMGALRAAELAPCGMRGIGAIYRMYATGEIDGDDEVGVLHGPAARGYPALTVALVNLRHAVREAAKEGLLATGAGERIVAAAGTLPFTFRTWRDIERPLAEEDRAALRRLAERMDSGAWDLKRRDAVTALREVARPGTGSPNPPAVRVPVTGISHAQLMRRRTSREYAPGRWMSDFDVLDAARLFDEDYPALHEAALVDLLRDLAGGRGMTTAEFAHAKLGLDERAALPDNLASWLTEQELARLTPAERTRLVMVRVWPVWHSVDWRPAVLERLRESERWARWCDAVAEAEAVAEETRYRLVVPPAPVCGRMFLRHWQRPGSTAQIEMARRGFGGLDQLGGVVRRYFAYDVRRARGRDAAGAAR
jgi:hypothetical protein